MWGPLVSEMPFSLLLPLPRHPPVAIRRAKRPAVVVEVLGLLLKEQREESRLDFPDRMESV